jgi:hypothetical protein
MGPGYGVRRSVMSAQWRVLSSPLARPAATRRFILSPFPKIVTFPENLGSLLRARPCPSATVQARNISHAEAELCKNVQSLEEVLVFDIGPHNGRTVVSAALPCHNIRTCGRLPSIGRLSENLTSVFFTKIEGHLCFRRRSSGAQGPIAGFRERSRQPEVADLKMTVS